MPQRRSRTGRRDTGRGLVDASVPVGYVRRVADTDHPALSDRVTRIEALLEHVATREDIEKAKNAILRWLIGTVLVALGLLAAIANALRTGT